MKILWLTWKDRQHPETGGAEVVNEELAKRLVADGHEVTFVVGGFKDCKQEEDRDGFKIIRLGNKYTVFYRTFQYYKKYLQGNFDLVIDEMNTVPFFANFYVKEKSIMFVHQLAREIWFYQIKFPMSIIGYILEPIYLWLLRNQKVITISESTKQDLLRFGFKNENISIISEGIDLQPVESLEKLREIKKYENFTILSLGAVRPMKRTLEAVMGFEEYMKKDGRNAELIIAGNTKGQYGEQVLEYIKNSKFKENIKVLGMVTQEKKMELMQRSHALSVTSLKEGWGLVVTEANSQGTIACVYNVDGLRDSVKNNLTGYVTDKNTSAELGDKFAQVYNDFFHSDGKKYREMQETAWSWSTKITFEQSYQDFIKVLESFTIDNK